MSSSPQVVAVQADAITIDGVDYPIGTVLGEVVTPPAAEGVLPTVKPTPKAAKDGVTRGHLEARLNFGTLACMSPQDAEALTAGRNAGGQPRAGLTDYKAQGVTNPDLVAEINRRRELGRNVVPKSQKKKDLIAALEADDDQQAAEAEADNKAHADAPPSDPAKP